MSAYCTIDDVGMLGINAAAIADIDPAVITAEIEVQSAFMDTFFDDQFTLPLVEVDLSVKKCCAVLTGAELLRTRGRGPDDADSLDRLTATWRDWLKGVAAGKWRPIVTDSSTSPTSASGFRGGQVATSPSRGIYDACAYPWDPWSGGRSW